MVWNLTESWDMSSTENKGCSLAPLILFLLPFAIVWFGWKLCANYLGSGWWMLLIFFGLSIILALVVRMIVKK
jgi:hypothetical protein